MLLLGLSELSLWSLLHSSLLAVSLNLELSLWSLFLSGNGISLGLVGLCCCIGLSLLSLVCHTAVELYEVRDYLLCVVGLPELKVGATLKQLAHTLRLADTRHLYHDSAFLSLKFLDVWLNNTELVDTGTYNVERVVDGSLHLLTECLLNLRVAALWIYLALQLLCGEDFSQLVTRCILVVGVDEE